MTEFAHNDPRRSPAAAWQSLSEGNERFRNSDPDRPNQDSRRRRQLLSGQMPHAVILSCSDSRAPVEILFDQGLGDVFVIRTAGEITDLSVLASLEYAVVSLEVPLVVVLGHEKCGAVAAAAHALETGDMPPGFQRVLVEKVTPSLLSARKQGLETMDDFERNHVKEIANHIVDRSPEVRQRIKQRRCAVVGLRYQLSDGLAEPVVSYGLDIQGAEEITLT